MKLNLTARLALGGALLVAIPLVLVSSYGYFTSTSREVRNREVTLIDRAQNLADAVNMVLHSELQIPTGLANSATIGEAINLDSSGGLQGDALARINAELHRTLLGLGNRYEGIFVANMKGILASGCLFDGSTKAYDNLDINDRAYFQECIARRKPVIDQPVKSKVGGDPICVLAAPIFKDGAQVGVIAISLRMQFLIDWVSKRTEGSTTYSFMVDKKGFFIAHPDKAYVLSTSISTIPGLEELSRRMTTGETGSVAFNFKGSEKMGGYAPIGTLGWSMGASIERSEFMAPVYSMRRVWLIIASGATLLAIGCCWWMGRRLSRPILEAVEHLDKGTTHVTEAAAHVAQSSQSVATMTTQQAAALEETSSSLEELSSMAKQNAVSAKNASTTMSQNRKTVETADQSLRLVADAMHAVCAASEESQKIIKTMDDIAFQTNILALNAAVEAARAGTIGAGFAVVAEEVRSLALRSAEASKQTAQIIDSNLEKIRISDDLVKKATSDFGELAKKSVEIETMLTEIANASSEQTNGVAQINQAVTQQDQSVQQNAAASEESASASTELTAQAKQMRNELLQLAAVVNGR